MPVSDIWRFSRFGRVWRPCRRESGHQAERPDLQEKIPGDFANTDTDIPGHCAPSPPAVSRLRNADRQKLIAVKTPQKYFQQEGLKYRIIELKLNQCKILI